MRSIAVSYTHLDVYKRQSKYYEESSPLFSKWNGAEPSDCEFLPLFSLAQTVLDNIDGIEISLPELD